MKDVMQLSEPKILNIESVILETNKEKIKSLMWTRVFYVISHNPLKI